MKPSVRMGSRWRWGFMPALLSGLVLASGVTAAAGGSAPERPHLAPGETNWVAPSGPRALATEDLTTITVADLVSTLAGAGVTISNVTYTGNPISAGRFWGGEGIIGFDRGIILSSGNIASVVGPNLDDGTSTDAGQPGDPDLSAMIGEPTNDAAVLQFDFECATALLLRMDYVFASEEYNEYVFDYNDPFAFFLNGTNIALLPDGVTIVSVDNVNCGNPYNPPTGGNNCGYFRNNDLDDGGGSIDTEMDGLTVVLSFEVSVPAGVNHIKLVVADALDSVLDSVVFLRADSFDCPCPELFIPGVKRGGQFPTMGMDDFASGASFKVQMLDGTEYSLTGLTDAHTIIGRSDPFFDGDPQDDAAEIGGGGQPPYPNTAQFAADPCATPSWWPTNPAQGHEIHTEILTMNLTGGGGSIKAGQAFYDSVAATPLEVFFQNSFGEVQGLQNDFPGDSFFNVFVEVNVAGMKFYNKTPMLLRSLIDQFPPNLHLPQSVYLHDPSWAPVPLFDDEGIHVAYLLSAGHGAPTVSPPPGECEVNLALISPISFGVDEQGAGAFPAVSPNHVRDDEWIPVQQTTIYHSSGSVPGGRPDITNARVGRLVGAIAALPDHFAAGDKINSVSYGRDGTFDAYGGLGDGSVLFSVNRGSLGAPCSAVRLGSDAPLRAEQAADLYLSYTDKPFGSYGGSLLPKIEPFTNVLIGDQTVLGLRPVLSGTGQDNVTALEFSGFSLQDKFYGTFTFACGAADCNSNGIGDGCETDCNTNGVPDDCDLAAQPDLDTNGNGILDVCEPCGPECDPLPIPALPGAIVYVYDDQNDPVGRPFARRNLVVFAQPTDLGLAPEDVIDALVLSDITDETTVSPDGVMDPGLDEVLFSLAPGSPTLVTMGYSAADIFYSKFEGTFERYAEAYKLGLLDSDDVNAIDIGPTMEFEDCNCNGIDDECDITRGFSRDCNMNAVPDECELGGNDCNQNNIPDECDIAGGTSNDCNMNGTPDECETDCNSNGIPDDCDIAAGTSADCDHNGTPDDCQPDCNNNDVADVCDIAAGSSHDCQHNGTPDECEQWEDCNFNGTPDECDISAGTSTDCNANGTPDECEGGEDCNSNGTLDECEMIVITGLFAVEPGWGDPPGLFLVNPADGSLALLGYLGPNITNAAGLAIHPVTGDAYAIVQDQDPWESNRWLASVNLQTASVIMIGELSRYLADITFRSDGTLFGAAGANDPTPGEMVIVNPLDASITTTGVFGAAGGGQSIAFQPGTNLLYHISSPDWMTQLELIDMTTGNVTLINSPLSDEYQSVVFDPSSNQLLASSWGDWIALDPVTGVETYLGYNTDLTGLAFGVAIRDCNGNGTLDECETDCNLNGVPDDCDLAAGTSQDVDTNGVPDECELPPDQLHVIGPVPNRLPVGAEGTIGATVEARFIPLPGREVVFTRVLGDISFTSGEVSPDGTQALVRTGFDGQATMTFLAEGQGWAFVRVTVTGSPLTAWSLFQIISEASEIDADQLPTPDPGPSPGKGEQSPTGPVEDSRRHPGGTQ